MDSTQRKNTIAISRLATCNPFSPTRFQIEKEILKGRCEPFDSIAWNRTRENREVERPNVIELTKIAEAIVEDVSTSKTLPDELHDDYWNVATYYLLYRHITNLPTDELRSKNKKHQKLVYDSWANFWLEYQRVFGVGGAYEVSKPAAAHLFACLTQIHRAFFIIFDHILGESLPISRLREQVWESIFTCSIRRYHDLLFDRMRDLSTLVTGPSGTGKELVARAIGLSQYVPFDHEPCHFQFESDGCFLPLNLSALSPTLIESELFGHRKGAFTGAVTDRVGWLESCSKYGAVFLDEIGELDLNLQVKLLRVLQERTYCRLGETAERTFAGKIIAATNRNLAEEIESGNFREDFYFRICTDRIETPTLQEQLRDHPEDLEWLVQSITRKHLGEPNEEIANDVVSWISENLGDTYPWHGNTRELEQCVRSFIIRQEYQPLKISRTVNSQTIPRWLLPMYNGELTAEEVLQLYCTWMYSKLGSYEKTSQCLKLDRRTVKAKIDETLLAELNG